MNSKYRRCQLNETSIRCLTAMTDCLFVVFPDKTRPVRSPNRSLKERKGTKGFCVIPGHVCGGGGKNVFHPTSAHTLRSFLYRSPDQHYHVSQYCLLRCFVVDDGAAASNSSTQAYNLYRGEQALALTACDLREVRFDQTAFVFSLAFCLAE